VAALLVAALLLIVAAGGLAWVNYTRSPAYSLVMLAGAVQNKDWDGVQKYVDVEAVVGQAVDAAIAKTPGGETGGLGALGVELAPSMKPALVQQAKDALRAAVEQGAVGSGEIQGVLVSVLVARQVKSVTYSGDEALVTVEVPRKSGAPFELRLTMKRVDDSWRVVAVENILDLPGLLSN